eukprot:TRINITY_DN19232_c0_g1_i1.p1 TRINITY_DN19232_c0_g1~~TRINITY_DN19232_c0_g1_i1.p1  ORF type:complete len:222 (+),score=84.86 TRINITY_DN19232_c0_g1_i1:60-725(+)
MGGRGSKDGAAPADPGDAFKDWSGRAVRPNDPPPDPKILNDIMPDDPFAGIDFQMVPMRVLESLRKKVEKDSLEACRPFHQESIQCLQHMGTRPQLCRPVLAEWYKCMAGWRKDNDDEYYRLVKEALEGKLLDKHRRRMKTQEREWKRRFPDMPMPDAHVPTRSPGEREFFIHELDRDLISRDLAMQRLAEIDALEQNLSIDDLKRLNMAEGGKSSWQPLF